MAYNTQTDIVLVKKTLPEGWVPTKLGDILEVTSSKRIFMSEYVASGVPFYRGKEIIEKANGETKVSTPLYISEERFVEISEKFGSPKENDILMSSVGTLGTAWLVGKEERFYFKDGNLTWLRNFKEGIQPKYILYWIKSPTGQENILSSAIGSTQPALTIDGLKKLDIAVPPEIEQKQIAEVLSSLDDKIGLNRKINANLEKLASSLFKKWFVDVGDKLPEGWRIGKVSDVIRVESGFPFNRSMFDESGKYKLVTIKNVQDGQFVSECTDSLSIIPEKLPDHCRIEDGNILLSLTGNVGRTCIVVGKNYLLNQRVAILIPIDNRDRAYTYLLFRQNDFQNTLMGISRGTAQQNLSPIETKSLEITIPAKEILEQFALVANPIIEAMVENLNQTKNLAALRDSILPRLMSGKIRVKI